MKNFCLLFAVLLITGLSYGQFESIAIDNGNAPDSKSESNGTRTLQNLPEYYNYNTNGSNNSFPFNISSGKDVQLLYLPGDFNQPVPAPAGIITSISVRIGDPYPLGPWNYDELTIKMGQSAITSFTPGALYTGTLTTVYHKTSVSLTGTPGDWMTLDLDTPFAYDPALSLIIDIGQCGAAGAVGFSACFTNVEGGGDRRIWSAGGCPFVYGGDNTSVYHLGLNMTEKQEVPISDWALYLAVFLVGASIVIRFRRF